jgi:hypothetical protein
MSGSELDRPLGRKFENRVAKDVPGTLGIGLDIVLDLVSLRVKSFRMRKAVITTATKERMARKTASPMLVFLLEFSASCCVTLRSNSNAVA